VCCLGCFAAEQKFSSAPRQPSSLLRTTHPSTRIIASINPSIPNRLQSSSPSQFIVPANPLVLVVLSNPTFVEFSNSFFFRPAASGYRLRERSVCQAPRIIYSFTFTFICLSSILSFVQFNNLLVSCRRTFQIPRFHDSNLVCDSFRFLSSSIFLGRHLQCPLY
jgi:hypothetical protein